MRVFAGSIARCVARQIFCIPCLTLRARPCGVDETAILDINLPMDNQFDWRGRVILEKLREGCIYREAAAAAGMTKQGVLWRMAHAPDFRQAVEAAREAGALERRYRSWLRHPFRGKRGPWWKPGVTPAFRYGRR